MTEKILANRYRLTEQIGMGGMAIVYRAVDLRTGHNVAVKVLRPEYNEDREFISRFQREAEAASKMTHHNIVNLLDVGMDGENRYLVMEYVQGKTLKAVIQERGKLNAPLACQITIRILSALEHAHRNGIIHRDIKPQNILVHEDGHIKVADFGIARIADSATLSRGDNVMGSVHYFSPEQARGEGATAASDIYSTGVVLYEMLTGRVPYDGDNPVAVAMQHLHAAPVPIQTLAPDVPAAVVRVCMKAMEKNPGMRYQSAREMAADLRIALEERGKQTSFPENELVVRQPKPQVTGGKTGDTGRKHRIQPPDQRKIIRITLNALLVLGVLAGIVFGGIAIYNSTISTVKVPDVYGMNVDDATQVMKQAGLKVTCDTKLNDEVKVNEVFKQNPEANTVVHKDDTVILLVSNGLVPFEMPDVTGKTEEEANTKLREKNMSVTKYVAESMEQKGTVIAQVPAAGVLVTRDEPVELTISGGSTEVPDLTNHSLSEAEILLANSNLTLMPSLKYEKTDDESKHGLVIASSPVAGNRAAEDTQVQLTLLRYPEKQCVGTLNVTLPEKPQQQKVRINVQAEGSIMPIASFSYKVDPTASLTIEETVEIPDDRVYSYIVTVDDSQLEQKTLTPARIKEQTGN